MGAALGTGVAELITAALMLYFLLVRSPLALISRYEVRDARYENTHTATLTDKGNLVPRTSHLELHPPHLVPPSSFLE
jgi:hypothetical protein